MDKSKEFAGHVELDATLVYRMLVLHALMDSSLLTMDIALLTAIRLALAVLHAQVVFAQHVILITS